MVLGFKSLKLFSWHTFCRAHEYLRFKTSGSSICQTILLLWSQTSKTENFILLFWVGCPGVTCPPSQCLNLHSRKLLMCWFWGATLVISQQTFLDFMQIITRSTEFVIVLLPLIKIIMILNVFAQKIESLIVTETLVYRAEIGPFFQSVFFRPTR